MRSAVSFSNRILPLAILSLVILSFGSVRSSAQQLLLAPSYYSPKYYYNPNQITVFDEDFFDSKSGPKFSKGISGELHYYGNNLNYNSTQREQWIEKCGPLKEKNFASFRKCFEREKKQAEAELEKRFFDVNAKSSQPLRNTWPTPEK